MPSARGKKVDPFNAGSLTATASARVCDGRHEQDDREACGRRVSWTNNQAAAAGHALCREEIRRRKEEREATARKCGVGRELIYSKVVFAVAVQRRIHHVSQMRCAQCGYPRHPEPFHRQRRWPANPADRPPCARRISGERSAAGKVNATGETSRGPAEPGWRSIIGLPLHSAAIKQYLHAHLVFLSSRFVKQRRRSLNRIVEAS